MPTSGWKGKLEYSKDSGSTWTEVAHVEAASPSLPNEEHNNSVFGDEGERRNIGRLDMTISVDLVFDMTDTTHQDMFNAVRDRSEWDWRVYPDRDNGSNSFECTGKVFDPDGDFSGGSNNTVSLEVRNSDGSKWTLNTA